MSVIALARGYTIGYPEWIQHSAFFNVNEVKCTRTIIHFMFKRVNYLTQFKIRTKMEIKKKYTEKAKLVKHSYFVNEFHKLMQCNVMYAR